MGQIVAYEFTGHANYAEHGKDIVCAAVSTLYESVTNYLIECDDVREISENYYELKTNQSKIICHFFQKSMQNIADSYPENVRVELIELEC